MKEKPLVDGQTILVAAATKNPWKDYLWKLAKEYKGLAEIAGVKMRLSDCYLEMERRFPDKETYERFSEILSEETEQDKTDVRLSLLPPR